MDALGRTEGVDKFTRFVAMRGVIRFLAGTKEALEEIVGATEGRRIEGLDNAGSVGNIGVEIRGVN